MREAREKGYQEGYAEGLKRGRKQAARYFRNNSVFLLNGPKQDTADEQRRKKEGGADPKDAPADPGEDKHSKDTEQ